MTRHITSPEELYYALLESMESGKPLESIGGYLSGVISNVNVVVDATKLESNKDIQALE